MTACAGSLSGRGGGGATAAANNPPTGKGRKPVWQPPQARTHSRLGAVTSTRLVARSMPARSVSGDDPSGDGPASAPAPPGVNHGDPDPASSAKLVIAHGTSGFYDIKQLKTEHQHEISHQRGSWPGAVGGNTGHSRTECWQHQARHPPLCRWRDSHPLTPKTPRQQHVSRTYHYMKNMKKTTFS